MRDLHRAGDGSEVGNSIKQRFSNPILHLLTGNQTSACREMHTLMCIMYVYI